MSADTELKQLLHDRFGVTTEEFVAALKNLPVSWPAAASITEDEARLLDSVGFGDDRAAFIAVSADTAEHTARLAVTAFTAAEVASGLGISASRVRQKRLAGELWSIQDGQSAVFPAMQFETDAAGAPVRQVRGLDRVFQALPGDLHPVSVAGFLSTPQPDLFHGRGMTPLEWLREGGDVDRAAAAAAAVDWYTT